MMFYHYSTRIEEYLAAIEGCDAFIVAERDDFKIINYINMGPDVFPDPKTAPNIEIARKWGLRRQCRGLIFNHHGDVISLPIEKFFNVGEREETQLNNIVLSDQHVLLEKLDGSMVRPIPVGNAYRMGTKMGITDVAMQSELFLADNPVYEQFIKMVFDAGWCPQFEWCSRKQKIVIDYPQDRLVLISLRNLSTGRNMEFDLMLSLARDNGIWDVVKHYPGGVNSMQHLLETTRDLQGQEGYVIRDGQSAYKIKADDYLIKHRAKDAILRENGVIEMILDEKLDDVKPVLSVEDLAAIEAFETAFWNGIRDTVRDWDGYNQDVHEVFGQDRKRFALEGAHHLDGNLRGAIFKAWDVPLGEFDWREAVLSAVRKNIGTQPKVDSIRHLFGSATWKYGIASPEDE